jgi:hypothetical protein
MRKLFARPLRRRTLVGCVLFLSATCFLVNGVRSGSRAHAADISYRAPRLETIRTNTKDVHSGTNFKPLQLSFQSNIGQTDPQVRYIANSRSGDVFLTDSEMVLRIRSIINTGPINTGDPLSKAAGEPKASSNSAVLRLRALNSNPKPHIVGIEQVPGRTNYFIGNDPRKWCTNVPSYAKVKYEDVYPGIDLIYYGRDGNLEYDFNVAPGADPSQISLSFDGADQVKVNEAGNLVLSTALGEVTQHAPHIYQQDGAGGREIAGGYALRRDGRVGFDLEAYDARKRLVIDPEVVYATYFGGSLGTSISGIAADSQGSVYVVGDTFAHDFPTQDPIQGTNRHSENYSAIVTKFSPSGDSLVYSTYLGGSTAGTNDIGTAIALDSTGAAYITGLTNSPDFPTRIPIQASLGGSDDVFVAKLSPDGSTLEYSTYLGGSGIDVPVGIVLDSSTNAYVFGSTGSNNFPTVNPIQANFGGGASDGFWAVISSGGSQLRFSTYLGGNDDDQIQSLTVNSDSGEVYISGQTQSSDFAGNDGSPAVFKAFFPLVTAGAAAAVQADRSAVSKGRP